MPINSSAPLQLVLLFMGCLFVVCGTLGLLMSVVDRQRQRAQESAMRVGLTGVLNRSAFAALAHKALQNRQQVSLLMLDLDFFKQVNDRHGHAAGDMVLVHAARTIANCCRATDLVGRYGGEEFCVLLVGCNERAAAEGLNVDLEGRLLPLVSWLLNALTQICSGSKCYRLDFLLPTMRELLRDLAVGGGMGRLLDLPGVGLATVEKIRSAGIGTIDALGRLSADDLAGMGIRRSTAGAIAKLAERRNR